MSGIGARVRFIKFLEGREKIKDNVYPDSNIDVLKPDEPPQKRTTFAANSTFVATTHFLKSMFTPTILVMPCAFKSGGLIFSIFGHIFLVTLVSYNIARLIVCADYLSNRENLKILTYDQVAFVSFDTCSESTRKWAKSFRVLVNIMSVVTTMDAVTIFMILVARNTETIASFYFPDLDFKVRHYIFFQMVVLMLFNTVRQLNYLTPFSFIATIVLYIAAICLFYFYLLCDLPSIYDRTLVGDYSIIRFISIALFTQSGISIALTLRSSMSNSRWFTSVPGIFFSVILLSSIFYVPFGFFGYLRYGEETRPSVLLNLPQDTDQAIAIKVMTILALLMTIPIGFYVSFNVIWTNYVKMRVNKANQLAAEYFLRALLAAMLYFLATAFPALGPMVVLKGALFHSQLEIIYPPIVEYVAFYPEKGSGKGHWRLIKAITISTFGCVCCVGGTVLGIWDLVLGIDELTDS